MKARYEPYDPWRHECPHEKGTDEEHAQASYEGDDFGEVRGA